MILSYEKRRNEEDYQGDCLKFRTLYISIMYLIYVKWNLICCSTSLAMQQADMEREKQQQKRQRSKRFNSQEGYRVKSQSRFKGDLQ